jgi:signal transduction histidine kinase
MLAIMGVTLLVLLTLLVPLAGYLSEVERERITTALERDAFVLAGRSEEALENADEEARESITDVAREYRASSGGRIVIVDSTGVAIVTSDDDVAAVGSSYLSRPEIATALSGQIATGTRYSQSLSQDLLYVAVPVLSGPNVLGAVRVTYPAQTVTDAVNSKLGALGIVALTTVLLAGIVGLILSRTVTSRLRRLTELTEGFAEGRLTERADERSGAPELRSLSRSFNAMAERLTASLDEQRRFAADASHQGRTPLTALRLRLERARELSGVSATESANRIAAAETEVDRLDTLVEGLLLLSRSEGHVFALETVDLARIARERVDQWRPLGTESGVAIEFEGAASAPILSAQAAIEQIADNLIDNALSVSAAGTRITVRVDPDGHGAALHVLDEGPGLPPELLERAFDRFWTGRAEEGGTGLGLSIVAQLAQASGGTVSLSNRASGGLDARVRFGEDWTPERARPRDRTRRRGQRSDTVGGDT